MQRRIEIPGFLNIADFTQKLIMESQQKKEAMNAQTRKRPAEESKSEELPKTKKSRYSNTPLSITLEMEFEQKKESLAKQPFNWQDMDKIEEILKLREELEKYKSENIRLKELLSSALETNQLMSNNNKSLEKSKNSEKQLHTNQAPSKIPMTKRFREFFINQLSDDDLNTSTIDLTLLESKPSRPVPSPIASTPVQTSNPATPLQWSAPSTPLQLNETVMQDIYNTNPENFYSAPNSPLGFWQTQNNADQSVESQLSQMFYSQSPTREV